MVTERFRLRPGLQIIISMGSAWVRIASALDHSSVQTWQLSRWFSNDLPPMSARRERCLPRRFLSKSNIKTAYYEAGHMMYIDVKSLAKLKQDVAAFIQNALPGK